MADWPNVDELKQALNVGNDDWNWRFDRDLQAAIRKVKSDRGSWDEDVDEPDDNLAQAALRMAELMSDRPESSTPKRWPALSSDPTYQTLMSGHRRTFGIG